VTTAVPDDLAEQTRRIWEDALSRPVRPESDFFAMDGHSFLAMRIIAALDTLYGTRLPLSLLFDNPRFGYFVAALARQLAPKN